MNSFLTPFFCPRGVIVVGAPTAPEKLGCGAARNLVYSGDEGAIHFTSQKAGWLFNRPLYCFLHIFLNLHPTSYLHNSGFWFKYLRSTL